MELLIKIFYKLTWYAIRPVFKFFTDFQVNLSSGLSIKKPTILVSNHHSLIDPFIIGISFPLNSPIHPLYFMVTDGVIKIPVLGFFIKLWGGFPTYHGQGLEVSLKKPWQLLEKGNNILIFPQGGWKKRLHANKGKVGTAVLALGAEIPILPLRISDPYPGSLMKFLLRKRKIKVYVGRPFFLAEKLNKKINHSRDDYIQATEIIIKEISQLP